MTSHPEAQLAAQPFIKIGALAPLSPPGWVEAGHNLLAGLELAASELNRAGGVAGKSIELLVRDTAADPQRAVAAVDELAGLGVVALAGEYHSVVARSAATRADILKLPFVCSSAVLDALTDRPTDWVARLSPAQSHGWEIYAEFLLGAGHTQIAVATQPSVYWASGIGILRDYFGARGGTVIELDMREFSPLSLCDRIVDSGATALVLMVGHPDPAVSIVRAVRADRRLAGILIGAPAGQPELADWVDLLGEDGTAVPFLRYLPRQLSPHGRRVEAALRERLGKAPSFVAFEGYDTITVLAEALRLSGVDRPYDVESWSRVSVNGTRGKIELTRKAGICVWQWVWAPIQVVQRAPGNPARFQVLHATEE